LVAERLYDNTFSERRENGLRILIEEDPQSRSVSVGAWVDAGSRDDPPEHPGIAHLIEHIAFKGTTERDALRISQEIDSVGGPLNAATGRESTVYYADVPAEGMTTAVDILADLVLRPAFEPGKVELERSVVLDEIRSHEDDPEATAFDRFVRNVWEDGHALTHPVLGTSDAVAKMPRDAIVAHHASTHRANGIVLAACGAVDADRFIDIASERFAGPSAAKRRSRRTTPSFSSTRTRDRRKTAQTHIYFALPGAPAEDPDRYALEVLNVILGDGTSSRLFRTIREDRGLAYSVGSSVIRYTDTGLWMVYAGTSSKQEAEVSGLLEREIERLAEERTVDADELALAKARLRGMFILGLESNASRAMRLGTAAITQREIDSPDEVLSRLDAIGGEDIERVIVRFVRPDALHQTVVGPT
jgi:predicted Zn-dependent peptidase